RVYLLVSQWNVNYYSGICTTSIEEGIFGLCKGLGSCLSNSDVNWLITDWMNLVFYCHGEPGLWQSSTEKKKNYTRNSLLLRKAKTPCLRHLMEALKKKPFNCGSGNVQLEKAIVR
ncbi:hypothetical protein M8C21_006274, partial [Ambrosia artemisiifolia]